MGCSQGSLHAPDGFQLSARRGPRGLGPQVGVPLGSPGGGGIPLTGPVLHTVGLAPVAPVAGYSPAAASRRAGLPVSVHDTVNDFLAERRRALGEGGGVDHGPRFNAYARYLGIDPIGEQDLLWVASCALHAPLPEGWTQHLDSQGRVFFYDARGSRSSWTHPLEQEHRELHGHLRRARLSGPNEAAAEEAVRARLTILEPEAAATGQDWTAHEDEMGTPFFYSRSAQRSSWTDPRPAAKHRAVLWRAALDVLEGRVPQETLAALLPGFGQEEADPDLPLWLLASAEGGGEGVAEGQSRLPDSWLSPRLLLAERASECPVCYEPLYCAQPSVLERVDNGRRLCGHYFCFRCAQRLAGSCPLCRARAPAGCTARALPSVERAPRQWFRMVDHSGNGRLEIDEVVSALEAVLPVDAERLRRALGVGRTRGREDTDETDTTGWWCQWQPSTADAPDAKPQGIGEEAFCREGGLLQWIVENLRELRRTERRGQPPELRADSLQSWFDFWASDPGSGLSRAELLRALMRTLGVSGVERQKVKEIRGTIEHCYHVWAPEGTHITREAFVKSPGGLGEQLISALLPRVPEDRPAGPPASPPAPPPAFAVSMPASERAPREERPAFLKSGSFMDLLQRLSRLRSASEDLSGVPEDMLVDHNRRI